MDITSDKIMSTVYEIKDLPPEMLKAILTSLVVLNVDGLTLSALEFWKEEFSSVIMYRQVNPDWRTFMDEVLEKNLISVITTWHPNRNLSDLFPSSISKVVLRRRCKFQVECTDCYPRVLVKYKCKFRFPGKVLIVEGCCRDCLRYDLTLAANVLIVGVYQHLSVLCLSNLSLQINVFRNILTSCQNIKVLVISKLKVNIIRGVDSYGLSMPALPRLTTLFLMRRNTFSKYRDMNHKKRRQDISCLIHNVWPFNAYVKQLKKLEIKCTRPIQTDPLPNLKQLSIITSSLSFLNEFGAACKLERLSISSFDGSAKLEFGTVYDMFTYIDKFSNSLVELYLDICLDGFYGPNDENKHFEQESNDFLQHNYYQQLRRSSLIVKYSFVHKLTIDDPMHASERPMFIEFILPKFIALQHLIFLRIEDPKDPACVYYPVEIVDCSSSNCTKMLWSVCPTLKNFSVLRRVLCGRDRKYTDTQYNFERPDNVN